MLSSTAAVAYNGNYNPQMNATVANNQLVNRAGDVTIDLTQADQEQPTYVLDIRIPGGWQFPFSSLRQGENTGGAPTTDCEQTIDNLGDGTNANAVFTRAEKIGSGFALAAADGITRPGPPMQYSGDMAFISWNAATGTAQLCLLLVTNDVRVSSVPQENVEPFTEVVAQFPLQRTTIDGVEVWRIYVDISDLYEDEIVQQIQLSVNQLKTTTFALSVGNWNPSRVNVAVNPATSGDMEFVGKFTNDQGTIVERTIPITIGLPAPTLTAPANGSAFTTSLVTITGTSDPGATVAVFDGPVDAGHATANASGVWAAPLTWTDGTHTIAARTIDAGGQSAATAALSFLVDTTPPPAPVIANPADASTVGGTTVAVNGTAEAGSTVRIYEGAILKATVPSAGTWSTSITVTKGLRTLSAQATDALGNVGPMSPPTTFTVITATPVILSPRQNRVLGKTDVVFKGTSEKNAAISVTESDVEIASTVADANGSWAATATLSESLHTVVATATADGFVSAATAPRTFTIDTSTPPPPEIITPEAGQPVQTNSFTVAGTAGAESTVMVREGTTTLGTTLADDNGDWRMTLVMDRGTHVVRAIAFDDRGSVSSDDHPITVGPALPHITGPATGGWQRGTFLLTGTADASAAELRVYNNGAQHASTTVGADGTWSVPVTFGSGVVDLSARTVREGALSPPTETRTYTVDASPPSLSVVNPSHSAAIVVRGSAIIGSAYDYAASADSGIDRVEVTYEDPSGLAEPLTVNASCTGCPGPGISWTDHPYAGPGLFNVTIAAFDRAGNRTSRSYVLLLV